MNFFPFLKAGFPLRLHLDPHLPIPHRVPAEMGLQVREGAGR